MKARKKRNAFRIILLTILLPFVLVSCLESIDITITTDTAKPLDGQEMNVFVNGDFPADLTLSELNVDYQGSNGEERDSFTIKGFLLDKAIPLTVKLGTYRLTATVIDAEANYGIETISFTVSEDTNEPPEVTITSPAAGLYPANTDVLCTVNVKDTEDGSIPSEDITWFVNNRKVGNGPIVVLEDFVPGEKYTIMAVAEDSDGASGSDWVEIEIEVPQGEPKITLTYISPYGDSDGYLLAKVTGVDINQHEIHAYGVVHDVFWIKPFITVPVTIIDANGEIELDFTTGGQDRCATAVYLYLVPKDTDPLLCNPCFEPPDPPEALTSLIVNRGPQERFVQFAGEEWLIKQSDCATGPGETPFFGDPDSIWVDEEGFHLTVRQIDGVWGSSEAILQSTAQAGTYRFLIKSRVDLLDKNLVLGIFIWDPVANKIYYREIDFLEVAVWAQENNPTNAQFVVQPCSQCPGCDGNCERFQIELTDDEMELTLIAVWESGRVEMRMYAGAFMEGVPPDSALIHKWEKSDGVPDPGAGNIRLNLWQYMGQPPSDGKTHEVLIADYRFSDELLEFPVCEDICSDDNVCTDDVCDPSAGCSFIPNEDPCDDSDACTENDVCSTGVCVAGTKADCSDQNECTTDSCDSATGCRNTANSNSCDDDNVCTVQDICNSGRCRGQTITCDDENICTDDSCSSTQGCVFTPNTDSCDDGDQCTEEDTCQNGICTGTPSDCGKCDVEITKAAGGYVYGLTRCYEPALYGIAVYIKVRGGWWTKPYWSMPITALAGDGTWRTDIITGGVDSEATEVCGFMVKIDAKPPSRGGHTTLPQDLYDMSIDYECVAIPFGE